MCTHPLHAPMKGFWNVIKPGEDQKMISKRKKDQFVLLCFNCRGEGRGENPEQARAGGGEAGGTVSLLKSVLERLVRPL